MKFVRLAVHPETWQVLGACDQGRPFLKDTIHSVEVDGVSITPLMVDIGCFADYAARQGPPLCHRLRQALRAHAELHGPEDAISAALTGLLPNLPKWIDAPATMNGVKVRLRRSGPAGINAGVRAWLATVLPNEQVAAMGLRRSLPISAAIAAQMVRNRRDPQGASPVEGLVNKANRIRAKKVQAREVRAKRAIERSQAQSVAADEAWEEHRLAVRALAARGANPTPEE